MKKVLKLYSHIGKFEFNKEYIKVDEPLIIELEVEKPINARMIANLDNGKDQIKLSVEDKIEVPVSFLRFGELGIVVQVIVDEQVVQTFTSEKLIIKEDKELVYVVPELELLKAKVQEYEDLVNNLTAQVNTLTDLVSGLYGFDVEVGEENE